jgi:hypothetical protein
MLTKIVSASQRGYYVQHILADPQRHSGPSGLGKPRRHPVEPPGRTRAVAQLAQ